ncbi:MAG: DUF1934 domain-containing protein [Ruminococcus sp.]|nr:DUF1934 domain-containing protein [Ruminococcus sp.]
MKKGNKKDVMITMTSVSDTGGIPDIIELITEGTLREVNNGSGTGWEISYADSEATGFAGSTTTVSCFGEEIASMTRCGSTDSNLIIEKNRRHHCHYGTPYGDMLLGISASRIINKMTSAGGELYFKYTIDINSALVSENEVYLNVEVRD